MTEGLIIGFACGILTMGTFAGGLGYMAFKKPKLIFYMMKKGMGGSGKSRRTSRTGTVTSGNIER
jgi:hypothetical protein